MSRDITINHVTLVVEINLRSIIRDGTCNLKIHLINATSCYVKSSGLWFSGWKYDTAKIRQKLSIHKLQIQGSRSVMLKSLIEQNMFPRSIASYLTTFPQRSEDASKSQ
jgi:hypothetical protein